MIFDELLVGLGFEYDNEQAKKFQDDITDTIGIVKSFVKVIGGAVTALSALTVASTKASDEQGKFATGIGESVSDIDALQFASKRAGGSADGLSSSLKNLFTRASEAQRGVGSGIEAFGLLGVTATDTQGKVKKSSDLFLEIADAFQKIDKARQIDLANKLGLSDSLLLLQQGRKGIKGLTDEARMFGVTTREDALISETFQDSLVDIWQIVKQVSRTLSRELAPILEATNDSISEWWKTNREIIEQNLPGIIKNITKAFKIMLVVMSVFLGAKLIGGVYSFVTSLKAVATWSAITQGAISLIPLALGLLIAGFALFTEDAKKYLNGQDSLFGRLIERFPEYRRELRETAKFLNQVYEGFKTAIKAVDVTIDALIENIIYFEKLIERASNKWKEFKEGTIKPIAMKFVGKVVSEGLGGTAGSGKKREDEGLLKKGFDYSSVGMTYKIYNFLKEPKAQPKPIKTVKESIKELTNVNKPSEKVSNVNINKVDIQINGTGDPKSVAKEVKNQLLTKASDDLKTEVDQ